MSPTKQGTVDQLNHQNNVVARSFEQYSKAKENYKLINQRMLSIKKLHLQAKKRLEKTKEQNPKSPLVAAIQKEMNHLLNELRAKKPELLRKFKIYSKAFNNMRENLEVLKELEAGALNKSRRGIDEVNMSTFIEPGKDSRENLSQSIKNGTFVYRR
jgi:hypothetical protein